MGKFLNSADNIRMGGGALLINKQSDAYNDFGIFESLGATEKESGGVISFATKKITEFHRENDRDEPFKRIVDGQDVTFTTVLVETTIENVAVALGVSLNAIGNTEGGGPQGAAGYKFFRFSGNETIKEYPFVLEVPNENDQEKNTLLIMPRAEVVGADEVAFQDNNLRKVKLVLRLRRATTGALEGYKFEMREDN